MGTLFQNSQNSHAHKFLQFTLCIKLLCSRNFLVAIISWLKFIFIFMLLSGSFSVSKGDRSKNSRYLELVYELLEISDLIITKTVFYNLG